MVTIKYFLMKVITPLILLFFTVSCSHIEQVKELSVAGTGLTLESRLRNLSMIEECENFQPTYKQIMKFFNNAQRVEGFIVTEDRYTPCYAKGKLTWRGGTGASWNLYSSGTASVRLDNGETIYLFQRDYQWFDPMECTYGLGDEGEC